MKVGLLWAGGLGGGHDLRTGGWISIEAWRTCTDQEVQVQNLSCTWGCSDAALKVCIRRNDKNSSLHPGISGQWSDGAGVRLDLSKESEDGKVYNVTQRAGLWAS